MENRQSVVGVHRMVQIALFAGVAYVLMFVSLPIIPIVPYMKLDLSDLVILIGMSILGPGAAMTMALVKALLYFVSTGVDPVNFIGVFTAFVADAAFILPISWVLRRRTWTVGRQVTAVIVGTVSLTVILAVANWAVLTPLYLKVLHMSLGLPVKQLVLFGVIPFNLIKGIVLGSLFILVNQRLATWRKRHTEFKA